MLDNHLQETLTKLKSLGVDIAVSECSKEDAQTYIDAVKTFINSMDFMRLGQSINHKQWQAAAMKANKMSMEAKRLGMTRLERPFTGIRQNINRRNSQEALQALSMIITIRVKLIQLLGIK